MTTTKLHNGDEMMLVEVPHGNATYEVSDLGNLFFWLGKRTLKKVFVGNAEIIGTYYRGAVDFEMQEQWGDFIPAIKSLTHPEKKYVILIKKIK